MAAPSSGPRVGVRRALVALVVALCLLTSTLSRAEADGGDALGTSGPGVLHGVVTGSDGSARADVAVLVYGWDAATNTWDEEEVAFDFTGDDGAFTVSGLATGRYTVEYVDSDYPTPYLDTWWGRYWRQEDAQPVEVTDASPAVDASIELLLGGTISGRVTKPDGAAVTGAQAVLYASDDSERLFLAETDSHGDYEIVGASPGSYRLVFEPPRDSALLETWWDHADSEAAAAALKIEPGTVIRNLGAELAAPATISGRLLDSWGNPGVGIEVEAWIRPNHGGDWSRATDVPAATTNSKGEFSLHGLRAGEYRLSYARGYAPDYRYQWWPGTTEESEAESVRVSTEATVQLGDAILLRDIPVRWIDLLTDESVAVDRSLFAVVLVADTPGLQRSYQWLRDGVPIQGATDDSYQLAAADVGASLSARVRLSAPGFVSIVFGVGQTQPVHKGTFTAKGNLEILNDKIRRVHTPVFVADASFAWEPSTGVVSYQWRREARDLAGETANTYYTTDADYGSRLSVVVRVTRPGYEPAEQVLTSDRQCYPASDIPPLTVTGLRAVGSTLTVVPGPAAEGTAVRYQWLVQDRVIKGETGSSITLTKALYGSRVRPRVTRTPPGCPTLTQEGYEWVPMTTLAPTPRIAGSAKVHAILKARPGAWFRGTKFRYRWYADGQAIAKATRSTYRIAKTLKDKVITVAVTGRSPGFETVTRTSAATRKVR